MSTIKSSAENLTLNADGANNDIKFQSNGSEVASIDQAGLLTATSFAGSGANLTSVPIADKAITLAKMASGTDGNIISFDASGNPVAIATGSDGQVLTSTGAGSPPAFEAIPAGGKVLQILAGNLTSTTTTTSSSYVATSLYLSITPSATSSKVLVICTGGMNGFAGGSGGTGNFTLFKDVGGGGYNECTPATTRGMCTFYKPAGDDYGPLAIAYLDSPSTTSAVTYKLYAKRSAGNGTLSLNRDGNGLCMIQCLEIGA
jgi:hypothetical protein